MDTQARAIAWAALFVAILALLGATRACNQITHLRTTIPSAFE